MNITIGGARAPSDIQVISHLFEQRLSRSTLQATRDLPEDERRRVVARFGKLLRELSTVLRPADAEPGMSSLDRVLVRLMHIISDAVDADRSTLFLYDRESDELFSRIAEGELAGEIRLRSREGIAGLVYSSGESVIISDAYADARFNPTVDTTTGYRTHSILCAPVRNWDNQIIGVAEALNKRGGEFTEEDLALLEALTSHAAAALETSHLHERVEKARQDEAQLLGVTAALSSELNLDALLDKIMAITTNVLDADRSTLFLHDPRTWELWSKVAGGLERHEIRIPADAGIAGAVFTRGETVNIPDAYADSRFNPAVDKSTGYRTESILCMPVVTNEGKTIGVTQVLNKRGGPFGPRDERRLQALGAQAAIALENARLFEDVLNARNYSESILKSLSNGVITLDAERRIIKANEAALRILKRSSASLPGRPLDRIMGARNAWVLESLAKVEATRAADLTLDADIEVADGSRTSVNLTIDCLNDIKDRPIGFMLVIEDITSEKRIKSTMARYMDRELAARLLDSGESLLGGTAQEATVLFSDIRSFTGLAERLGARDTVSMLNEYFSEMVDVVFRHKGILDKYIGDAIMAVFGTPFPSADDASRAVAAAVDMMETLDALNRRRALASLAPIDIRLGISTGEVLAGNIGSPKRMDYTVIGDSVNLASRLESANKFYDTHVLISEYTVRALNTPVALRELDLIRVKGREEPVAIYQVLGRNHRDAATGRSHGLFAKGLARYRARDWCGALEQFRRALALTPADRPTRIFLDRAVHYQTCAPDDDWDGVWTMKEK